MSGITLQPECKRWALYYLNTICSIVEPKIPSKTFPPIHCIEKIGRIFSCETHIINRRYISTSLTDIEGLTKVKQTYFNSFLSFSTNIIYMYLRKYRCFLACVFFFLHYPTSLKCFLPSNSLMYKPKSHHLFNMCYNCLLPINHCLVPTDRSDPWTINILSVSLLDCLFSNLL